MLGQSISNENGQRKITEEDIASSRPQGRQMLQYSVTFQMQLHAEMFRDNDFGVLVKPHLKDVWFDKDSFKYIERAFSLYVDIHKKVPANVDNFLDHWKDLETRHKPFKVDDDMRKNIKTLVTSFYTKNDDGTWKFENESETTRKKVDGFVKAKAHYDALLEVFDMLLAENYDGIHDKMIEANQTGVIKPKDLADHMDEKFNNEITAEKTGYRLNRFPRLEQTLEGIQPKFNVIAGETSQGKTALLTNIFLDAIESNSEVMGIYISCDDNKNEIINRLLSIRTNTEMNDIKSGGFRDEPVMLAPIKEGYEYLKQLYRDGRLLILDIADINSIAKIEMLINKHKDRKLFVAIDALYNLMTQDKKKSRGIREDNIDRANDLLRLVSVYNVPIYATAECRKINKNKQGEKPAPTMDDINETGKYAYNASVVIMVYPHNPESVKETKEHMLVLDMQKNKQSGVMKTQYVEFSRFIGKITEIYGDGCNKYAPPTAGAKKSKGEI